MRVTLPRPCQTIVSAIAMSGLLTSTLLATPAAANNITVERTGNEISIDGDSNSNSFAVYQSGDRLIIRGVGGTTVNQSPRVTINDIDLSNLEIETAAGNDIVRLYSLTTSGEVSVNLGTGNDQLVRGSTPCDIGGELEVIGGSGNDFVNISGWIVNDTLSILGNAGVLRVRLNDVMIGDELEIVGGARVDNLRVANAIVGGEVDIRTRGGNDRIVLLGIDSDAADVASGPGDDLVLIRNTTSSTFLEVATREGDDLVVMSQTEASLYIEVLLGDDEDEFRAIDVFADVDVFASGGPGTDILLDRGLNAGVDLDIVGFEIQD